MIGSAMYFSYIELNFPSVKETIPNGKELEIKQHCKLFFNQVGDMFKVKRLTRIRQNSMLIKRHDLGEKMSSVFNYWFDEQEKLSEKSAEKSVSRRAPAPEQEEESDDGFEIIDLDEEEPAGADDNGEDDEFEFIDIDDDDKK